MYTRILTALPTRIVVINRRTLATLQPAAPSVLAGTRARPSTATTATATTTMSTDTNTNTNTNTNTVSVVAGSSPSSDSTIHPASNEEASKKPYMVDGGMGGRFGGIPMGAFAVSNPFEHRDHH